MERILTDSGSAPTDELVRQELEAASEFYTGLMALVGGFRRQWQFHKGKGWILKVEDRRKALFYLIPFKDRLEISLTVREAERDAYLADEAFAALGPAMEAARKYPEGYALRFGIENAQELAEVVRFLTELIRLRAE